MGPSAGTARFRYSMAIPVAALIVFIAGLSLARWAAYLLPLLLIPLAVAVWGARAGTDANADGLIVRAALGRRRVPWSAVAGLVTAASGRVRVELTSGTAVDLPAVTGADVATLVAASGTVIESRSSQ